jgi:plasmid stabilization system protein ParE
MPVVLQSLLAKADLRSIWVHIAQGNAPAADNLLEKLLAKCELIVRHPRSGNYVRT